MCQMLMKPTRYLINSIKFILIPNSKKLKTSLFKLYLVIFDNIQNLVILFFPSSHHLYKLMLNAFSVQDCDIPFGSCTLLY